MWSVETACPLHKFVIKWIRVARIMSHTLRQCATNVFLRQFLSKDKNTDMLIMLNSWMLIKCLSLSSFGFKRSTWLNKELGSCMDIMLKILTIRMVFDVLWRPSTNQDREEHSIHSKFFKLSQNSKELISLSKQVLDCKKLDGYILKKIMMLLWVKIKLEWLQDFNNWIRWSIHLDTLFLTLSLLF